MHLPFWLQLIISVIAIGLFATACLLAFSSVLVDENEKPVKEKRVMFRHLF